MKLMWGIIIIVALVLFIIFACDCNADSKPYKIMCTILCVVFGLLLVGLIIYAILQ